MEGWDVQRDTATDTCLTGTEVAEAIQWWEHLNHNFDQLLESECELG